MTVAENLARVRARIDAAARRAGRDPASVRLLAVSKTQDASAVRAAHAAGQRDFGENYVQEMIEKAAGLADLEGIRWHFIGHLQRNKVAAALGVARTLHSVDSARLADAIGKRATAPVEVYVEVNVAGEAQKTGCTPADLPAVLEAIRAHPRLVLRGLMTVPPFADDPEASRPFFRALQSLRGDLPEISMGMTADLEVAIEEGATVVRVGTAIFGPRSP